MHKSIALILAGTMCLAFPAFVHASGAHASGGAGGRTHVGEAARSPVSGAGADAFLHWAAGALRTVSVDPADGGGPGVRPLLDMIGPAQFVAFSEATHSEGEILRFRNALFLALAREQGYRVLAMESGLSEGAMLHDYVQGGSEPLDAVVDRGFSWGFGEFPSNRRLLQALRQHNASQPDAAVALYGFDVPGSPGNTIGPARGANVALEEALAYLRRVDEAAYEGMRPRVSGFVGLDPRGAMAYYGTLDSVARDRLTGAIADLVGLFERHETAYTRATSPEAFAWGLRHAVGARQIDSMLRLRSPGMAADDAVDLVEHHAYRDRAMADNIEWIRSREGLEARIMIFAARFHISGAPVLVPGWSMGAPVRESITLGSHLRARYGERAVRIGHILGQSGACGASSRATTSVGGLLSTLGRHSFVLDLRQAPPAVRTWLDRTQALDREDDTFSMNLAQAFDILYYNQVEPPDCRS